MHLVSNSCSRKRLFFIFSSLVLKMKNSEETEATNPIPVRLCDGNNIALLLQTQRSAFRTFKLLGYQVYGVFCVTQTSLLAVLNVPMFPSHLDNSRVLFGFRFGQLYRKCDGL